MSSNVEPEEAQAILSMMEGKSHAEATISERDFRKPCRLSQPELEEVEGRAVESIGDLGTFFSDTLGSPCRVDLVGVGESNAEGLFSELGEHFALLRFQCRGAIGWLAWDNRAAVAALERIFGTAANEPEARRLSRLENQILGNLLANFAAIAAAPLDATLEEFVVVENEAQVGSWRDAGGEPDPHRLHLEFSLDSEDETSVVHVYLPGFQKEIRAATLPADLTLPSHLKGVSVEISVRLAECEIPLAQLLSLEEGDVIPTCVPVGTLATVLVEGREAVRARLGQHRGLYAVRVEELIDHPEPSR